MSISAPVHECVPPRLSRSSYKDHRVFRSVNEVRVDSEAQPRSESNGAQHTEWIVQERAARRERRSNDAVLEIRQALQMVRVNRCIRELVRWPRT